MGVVRVRVIGLEDVGGGRGARWLKQRAILQNDGQLVLRTGQRHALDGGVRQRCPGQLADARLQRIVGQGAQGLGGLRRGLWRQQGQRPGGFRPVPGQQAKGVRRIQPGILGQQHPLIFFRQQIVKVPLHRALAGAIQQRLRRQGNVRAERKALGVGQPVRGVLKTPQPCHFLQTANFLLID